jgi:WD40 repeat protein
VAAFEAFLKDWPESNQAKVARKRIKELKGVPTRRWLLQGLGAAVGLAVVVGALQPGFLLWRVLHDQSIRTFIGHSDQVRSVAFAPDGRTALSGSFDKRLKLWDLTDLK